MSEILFFVASSVDFLRNAMASEVLSSAQTNGGQNGGKNGNGLQLPHVTTVNIRDSDAAILSSMYRLSNEILHHKWLLRQR